MKEIERIADQLKRAVEGEAWHGPSLNETLAQVSAQAAAARPMAGGHTPWEIALHIGAWLAAVRRRLGGQAVELSPEEDWAPVGDATEAAWEQARARLSEAGARNPWLDDVEDRIFERNARELYRL